MRQTKFTYTIILIFLTLGLLYSQWLETTIQVGNQPCALVWNSSNNKVCCAIRLSQIADLQILKSLGIGKDD